MDTVINKVIEKKYTLYIGSEDAVDLLEKYNIKTLISVGCEFKILFEKRSFPTLKKHYYVNISDHESAKIEEYFAGTNDAINNGLSYGNVLLHCQAGVSRSATLIIAYLLLNYNFTYEEATDYLKKCRGCIQPNEGFVKKLKDLSNNIINAQ